MRPANTDLFDLVETLTQGEKNFISRKLSDETSSSKLFEYLTRQSKYDETQAKEHLFGKRGKQQYAVVKKNLYDDILVYLNNYHEKDKKYLHLLSLIQSIDLLYSRHLFNACLRTIEKAEKIALAYEYDSALQEVLIWKLRVHDQMGLIEKNQIVFGDIENAFERVEAYLKFGRLITEISIEGAKNLSLRSKVQKDNLTQLLNEANKEKESAPDTFRIREFYHAIHGVYYRLVEDFEASYDHWTNVINLYKDAPEFSREEPIRHIMRRLSRLIVATGTHNPKQVFEETKHIRSIIVKHKLPKFHPVYHQAKVLIHFTEIEILINYGRFQEAVDEIPSAESTFKKERIKIALIDQMKLQFLFAYAYFGNAQYKESLQRLNQFLRLPTQTLAMEFQITAKLIHIILHFELKNYQLVFSLIKSTTRWLKQTDSPYQIEKLFIKYFDKLIDIRSREDLLEQLVSLRFEIEKLIKDPYEKNALTWFNFIAWLDSKIEGIPFSEMVRK